MKNSLRAMVGNAVVWGAGFFATAFATLTVLRFTGAIPPWRLIDGIGMAMKFAAIGVVISFVFAGVIRVMYRGRRLRDISPLRFGLAGAAVAGIFVPLFLETSSIVTGGGVVPMNLITSDIVFAALFGGIVAGASLKLAQRVAGETRAERNDSADIGGSDTALLASGAPRQEWTQQRAGDSVQRDVNE